MVSKPASWALLFSAFLPGLAALLALPNGEPTQTKVTFYDDVLPLLKGRCASCHSADSNSAGLALDSYDALMKGGISGRAVVPGKAGESLLVFRIVGSDHGPQMPLGYKPLDEKQIATIKAWINAGAEEGKQTTHWAYVRPVRPELPAVGSNPWVRNPIDAFVLAKLTTLGLKPSAEASKSTLVRRLYLDVLGLPPTEEEVESFLQDTEPGAYERLVDKVLASPHYGERQARIWLDLARYADTQGFEADRSRTMWPWRDYVIKSFNTNKPFDKFTVEQFAGDLLPDATIDQIVATGYHRNTMYNEEGGVDRGEQRWLTLVDRVSNTGTVWLGSTLGCAQCHDHKFDPVPTKDFYAMLAYWESADEPMLDLNPEVAKARKPLESALEGARQFLQNNANASEANKKAVMDKIKETEIQLAALPSETTLVLKQSPTGKSETPIRNKGMYLSPGDVVHASTPSEMGGPSPDGSATRLELANWLVSKENPLTARVQVNRMWEQHFGFGLVKTAEDFGTQGERPVNQPLLDWLACEFMDSGWDAKHIHKLIVLSATYRQVSTTTPALVESDPENRYQARGPRFRLEAEAIRDSLLVASGLLSRKIGGPSVMPTQPAGIWNSPYSGEAWTESSGNDKHRRGIYTFWKRSATYPMFTNFDATSRESCTARRIRTNTPLQALNMLNDPVVLEASRALATRVMASADSPGNAVDGMFVAALCRRPTAAEQQALVSLMSRSLTRFSANPDEAKKLAGVDKPAIAAATVVANVLFNLDEFINLE